MKLTTEQVEHIASLARLSFTPAEIEQYQVELSNILTYIEQLNELDLDAVAPTSHITSSLAHLRPDVIVEASDETKASLRSAFPARLGDLLAVPPVFSNYKE